MKVEGGLNESSNNNPFSLQENYGHLGRDGSNGRGDWELMRDETEQKCGRNNKEWIKKLKMFERLMW